MSKHPAIRYLKKNIDEIAIITTLGKVAFENATHYSEVDQAVLAALRRSSEHYRLSSIDDIGKRLASFDDNQIDGLVNNVKGILHEMEYVRVENEDGDSVFASLYADTNNPEFDVMIFAPDGSAELSEIQLKSTTDAAEVELWLEDHPEGEIVVNSELATELNLTDSGFSNEALTVRVDDFVDRLVTIDEPATLGSYFPALAPLSAGFAVWELWRRHQRSEISLTRFRYLSAAVTAGKISKMSVLLMLLSLPGVNAVVGAAITAKMIVSSRAVLEAAAGDLRLSAVKS